MTISAMLPLVLLPLLCGAAEPLLAEGFSSALAEDDQCSDGGGAPCAMNALQLKGSRVQAVAAEEAATLLRTVAARVRGVVAEASAAAVDGAAGEAVDGDCSGLMTTALSCVGVPGSADEPDIHEIRRQCGCIKPVLQGAEECPPMIKAAIGMLTDMLGSMCTPASLDWLALFAEPGCSKTDDRRNPTGPKDACSPTCKPLACKALSGASRENVAGMGMVFEKAEMQNF